MGAKSDYMRIRVWSWSWCCRLLLLLVRGGFLAPAVYARLTQSSRYRGFSAFLVKPLPQILSDVDDAG
jgi:hypothetical protein